MNEQGKAKSSESWWDAAVSGLLAGIVAGVVMAAFLAAAGFAAGESVAQVLSHFGAGEDAAPVAGLFTHLAVSGIYGIFWGYVSRILRRLLPAPAWQVGLAYGLLLFLLAQGIFLAGPTLLTGIPSLRLLIAHGIYGLVSGAQGGRAS